MPAARTEMHYDRLFIDGEWTPPATSTRLPVVEAATGRAIGAVPAASVVDIDRAVAAARRAFDDPTGWAHWSPERRGEVLERWASALEARSAETARCVSVQNGMPLWLASSSEAVYPALRLRYYLEMARDQQDEIRSGRNGKKTLVRREAIGVVAAIVPWNFPQSITFVKIAPALAAGNTVVVKPAPETVLDAMVMATAAAEAGFPPGVVNVVPAGRDEGAALVAHPGVDKVSFTGSTAAGRRVAESCGRGLKPVTLELGGKSAAILLDDVDLDRRLDAFFATTLINNGQTCWACTRVLAPRRRYDAVLDTVTSMAGSLAVGDPLEPDTRIGPLVSQRQRERVEAYIARGRAEGGRTTTGGGRSDGRDEGWFVEPTVFTDVDPMATIAQEEIFGPVLVVIPYADEADAVALANASQYGLGGTVWSEDPQRAAALAARIHTGTIGVNGYVNDPRAPFGGVKNSGIGRESGPEGLAGYQNLKTIYLDEANDPA